MAKDTESTYSYNLDIAKLRRGLQDARREISLANAEFKNATAGMGKWSTSATGLEAKTAQLSKTLKGQNAILDNLKAQYDATAQEMGEASPAAQKLKIQIEQQEASCKKTAAQLDYYTQQLEELEREQSEAEKPISKLSDTIDKQERELEQLKKAYANATLSGAKDEAQELATQIDKLSGELRDNKAQMEQATGAADKLDKSLEDVDDAADRAGDGFTVMKGVLSELITDGIKQAASYVGSFVDDAIKAADALQKFEKTMDFAGIDAGAIETARQAVKQYADDTVYDLDTIANTTAQLAANGVQDYTALTQAAGNLNAVAGGNADTFSSVTLALVQTAGAGKLTTENWNQLTNAVPGASGRLQDALKRAGAYTGDFRTAMSEGQITADEFNAALLELGTDPVAVEAAKSIDTFEGATGDLEASITSAFLDIYETIGSENITGTINSISQAIQDVTPLITDLVKAIADNKDVILATLAGVATTVATIATLSGISTVVGIISKLVMLVSNGVGVFAAFNAVLGVNPLFLLAGVIGGVVVALVTLYKTNEDFRKSVNKAWKMVTSVVSGAVDKIVGFFTQTLPQAIKDLMPWFQKLPNGIKAVLSQALAQVVTWAASMARKAREAGEGFVRSITAFFAQLPAKIAGYLAGVISSATAWVAQMAAQATQAGTRFVTNIVTFFSQLSAKIAGYLSAALASVVTWVASMAAQATQAGTRFIANVAGTLGGIAGRVAGALSGALNAAASFAANFAAKATGAASSFVSKLAGGLAAAPGKVAGVVSSIVGKLSGLAGQMANKATGAASSFVSKIKSGLEKAVSGVREIGQNIARGVVNGVRDMAGWAVEKIKGFGGDIERGLKNFFGIKSPSRLMRDEVGKMLAQGIVVGFGAEMPAALATMRRDMQGITSALSSTIGVAIQPQAASLASSAQATAAAVNQSVTINQTIQSSGGVDQLTAYRATKSALFTAKGALAHA